jgi:septal ring factor EnvC (AmiA/AmiB activator)
MTKPQAPQAREYLFVGRYRSPRGEVYAILEPFPLEEGAKFWLVEKSALDQANAEIEKLKAELAEINATPAGEQIFKLQRELAAARAESKSVMEEYKRTCVELTDMRDRWREMAGKLADVLRDAYRGGFNFVIEETREIIEEFEAMEGK